MSERLELNDELLCAYMDGELDADMRARVEKALIDDAGARVRLERMRVADERLKSEIPLPSLQPNDALSERILSGKPAPRAARVSLGWAAGVSALAAGVAGVVLGFVLSRTQQEPVQLSGASTNALLLAALENAESGTTKIEGRRSVHIILTFETEDGRYCRAFGARDEKDAAEGVACRNAAQWQVMAWDGTADRDEVFRAAGSSELLDDVMDRLGGGAALESAEERTLIEQHWSVPR